MVINPLIAGPPHCAPSLSLYLSITPSLSPPQTHVTLGEDRRVTNTQTEENNYKLVRKVLQVEMIVPAYCKGKQTLALDSRLLNPPRISHLDTHFSTILPLYQCIKNDLLHSKCSVYISLSLLPRTLVHTIHIYGIMVCVHTHIQVNARTKTHTHTHICLHIRRVGVFCGGTGVAGRCNANLLETERERERREKREERRERERERRVVSGERH